MNDERPPRERLEDPEAGAEICEIDDEIEEPPRHGGGLGLVGQLVATLTVAAIVALLIIGALAVLSWLFT